MQLNVRLANEPGKDYRRTGRGKKKRGVGKENVDGDYLSSDKVQSLDSHWYGYLTRMKEPELRERERGWSGMGREGSKRRVEEIETNGR